MKTIILTREIFEQGRSERGSWSLKQFQVFGIKKFKKGWKRKIIGKAFPVSAIERFLELKDAHLKPDLQEESGYTDFLRRVED